MDLSDWITRHAAQIPDHPALRFAGNELSYAAFAALVERQAAALVASGVARGGCVAYLGYNSPTMLGLLFACARLGAMFMPLNWRLAGPEHRQMLLDCPPRVIFVEPPFVAQIEVMRGELGGIHLVAFATPPKNWLAYPDWLELSRTTVARNPQVDMQTPLLICYTSGSTGKPKGVLLPQAALQANALSSLAMHDMTQQDRILTTLPLFHVGGLNILTTPALYAGCMVSLHPKFDPDETLAAIEQERITLAVLVPAQLDMLMAHPRWQSANLTSLRMITTGSSIVSEKMIRAVHARGVPLVQVYGSTETCPIATYIRREDAERKLGSAGCPAPGCEVRIDDGAGRDLPVGGSGEILVRGANVMIGYWNAPDITAAALRDGWFHSGDMGHWDEDGYLFVDGRKKDMIISGGENIYPAEIENLLIELPDIAEVSVVGRPDQRWGEIVVAFVVPKPHRQLTPAQVLAQLEGRIARFKHPKQVILVTELPKTALGKVRKEELRQIAQQQPSAG
ncbi:MAG: o-succinylbenzoate--CoA ligase [Betaproteobacteria bacterium]|nr:o-succinylbenzoate--CoA ligase [Betaproteobacteria bacterium]